MTELLWTGPEGGPVLVLAHGAGSPMDSEWMDEISRLIGERGVRVVRFEFAYMAARRAGSRRPPSRVDALMAEYREAVGQVVDAVGGPVVLGGKSLGGRVATMVADQLRDAGAVRGVIALGYPFHPSGNPSKTRTEHLATIATPTLICQGTRDPFGSAIEVADYALSPSVRIAWLEDGEHGFAPRPKLSGRTLAGNLAVAADAVAEFLRD